MPHSRMFRLAAAVALALLLALPTFAMAAQSPSAHGGTYDQSLEFGGRQRTFRVHVPLANAPAAGMPLLIVLHGGGGNGKQVERATGFSDLADQKGFIAVYPDGTGRTSKRLTWDAHNCCAFAYSQQVDDVGFVSALIDQILRDYDVDPSRVYLTGHSNGAMMTFRLACELSGKIAAAAPYAGALNADSCIPDGPVPMLIMNGEDDRNVPVAGGASPNVGYGAEDTRIDQPTSYAVETWVTIDGCDPIPTVADSDAASTSTYSGCSAGTAVQQILIRDWDHPWPLVTNGAPFDASPVIWEFVSRFSKQQA